MPERKKLYYLDSSPEDRHQALVRAANKDGCGTIVKRLTWLARINKKRPAVHKKVMEDISFLRKKFKSCGPSVR